MRNTILALAGALISIQAMGTTTLNLQASKSRIEAVMKALLSHNSDMSQATIKKIAALDENHYTIDVADRMGNCVRYGYTVLEEAQMLGPTYFDVLPAYTRGACD